MSANAVDTGHSGHADPASNRRFIQWANRPMHQPGNSAQKMNRGGRVSPHLQSSTARTAMPPLLRKPRRLIITVSDHIYQKLLSDSDLQGRSLSNYAAFMLETSLERRAMLDPRQSHRAYSLEA